MRQKLHLMEVTHGNQVEIYTVFETVLGYTPVLSGIHYYEQMSHNVVLNGFFDESYPIVRGDVYNTPSGLIRAFGGTKSVRMTLLGEI
jgi:hypothetical protein